MSGLPFAALGLAFGLCIGTGTAHAQAGPNTRPKTGALVPSGTETSNSNRTIQGGQAQTSSAQTPAAQDFLNAASDHANWILPAKSYTANHYTGATQINPGNVGSLHLAWKFQMDDDGPVENSPIVWNGTMYVTSAHDHVYALDAATGKLKWEFSDNPHVIAFAANRGVGLLDGNVYIGTLDGHLIALNAETGKKVWDILAVHDPANSFYTMAPVPYHNSNTNQDMLLLGVSDGDWGGIGYIGVQSQGRASPLGVEHHPWPRRAGSRHLERGFLEAWLRRRLGRCDHRHRYADAVPRRGESLPGLPRHHAEGRKPLHGLDARAGHFRRQAEAEMVPPVHPA